MISPFYITAAYFLTILLTLVACKVRKISFTLFNGFFAAWIFILGGTLELIYGKTSFGVFIGVATVLGGVYLNYLYLKLYRLIQEYKALETSSRMLKEEHNKKMKKIFWDVRN